MGVVKDVSIIEHEERYKGLYGKLKIQFDILLNELRKMRNSTPSLRVQIETIEAFLLQLDGIIAFPKFIQIEKEK